MIVLMSGDRLYNTPFLRGVRNNSSLTVESPFVMSTKETMSPSCHIDKATLGYCNLECTKPPPLQDTGNDFSLATTKLFVTPTKATVSTNRHIPISSPASSTAFSPSAKNADANQVHCSTEYNTPPQGSSKVSSLLNVGNCFTPKKKLAYPAWKCITPPKVGCPASVMPTRKKAHFSPTKEVTGGPGYHANGLNDGFSIVGSPLGSGKFGIVHEVVSNADGQTYAAKTLRPPTPEKKKKKRKRRVNMSSPVKCGEKIWRAAALKTAKTEVNPFAFIFLTTFFPV